MPENGTYPSATWTGSIWKAEQAQQKNQLKRNCRHGFWFWILVGAIWVGAFKFFRFFLNPDFCECQGCTWNFPCLDSGSSIPSRCFGMSRRPRTHAFVPKLAGNSCAKVRKWGLFKQVGTTIVQHLVNHDPKLPHFSPARQQGVYF